MCESGGRVAGKVSSDKGLSPNFMIGCALTRKECVRPAGNSPVQCQLFTFGSQSGEVAPPPAHIYSPQSAQDMNL